MIIKLITVAVHCVLLLGSISGHNVSAQQATPVRAEKSPLCTRENALDMIKQQIALTKTGDYLFRRATVLIRAADLLWPYDQEKARATFAEAFALAVEQEEENDRAGPRSVILRMEYPDYRYVVIRAIAKRDSAWAKELTQQILKPDRKRSTPRDDFHDLLTSERLLQLAREMLATDINTAVDLFTISLNYPASPMLTRFLYSLAAVNQPLADQLYAQALAVYSDKPIREFLYLQAYPFAWRDVLNTPIFVFFFEIPVNVVEKNRSLQRQLVQTMLRRAQQIELSWDEADSYRDPSGRVLPGALHLLKGLLRLEPKVRESFPDLLPPLIEVRDKILVSLSAEWQNILLPPEREISVTGDASLRAHLSEWLYFDRATTAIRNNQLDEAETLTAKVEGLEQRAYLHTEIARGLLRHDGTYARKLLDDAVNEAKKAGVSIFTVRTLLTASNLYAKIEPNRSIELLADAVNCINHIDTPDFYKDDQTLVKNAKGKTRGGMYGGEYDLRFFMPGLDPERAFREMAKIDFDTALLQSSALTDKLQRSLATLSLAEVCLAQTSPKPESKQ